MATDPDDLLALDTVAFKKAERRTPPETVWVVMRLIGVYTRAGSGAFHFDPVTCTEAMLAGLPATAPARAEINPEVVARLRPYLLRFFVELPDGRWAPNPAIFGKASLYGET